MVTNRLQGLLGRFKSDEEIEREETFPSDDVVINYLAKNPEVDKNELKEITTKVQKIVSQLYPILEDEAIRPQDEMAKKDSDPSDFLYIIDETDEMLIMGGAKGIFINLADRLDLSKRNTEAVIHAHKAAASFNGYAEHLVMDDVLLIPKDEDVDIERKSTEAEQRKNEQLESFIETHRDGYDLPQADEIIEDLVIDGIKYFGMDHKLYPDKIRFILSTNKTANNHHGILNPDSGLRISREIGLTFDIEGRDLKWGVKDGDLVMETDSLLESEPSSTVKTSLEEDEGINAVIPGMQLKKIGVEEGDSAWLFLDTIDGEPVLVITGEDGDLGTEIEIESAGRGAEKLYAPIPEDFVNFLGLDVDNQIEWGSSGDYLIGKISP